jgi:hypothetical protein
LLVAQGGKLLGGYDSLIASKPSAMGPVCSAVRSEEADNVRVILNGGEGGFIG